MKCLICDYSGSYDAFKVHLKKKHRLSYTQYCKKFDLFEKCKWCGQSLGSNKKKDFCSKLCRKRYENSEKYKDISDMPYCRICGMKLPNPTSHLNRVHGISVGEYMKKFNLEKNDVFWDKYLNFLSNKISGDKNPVYNHGGKYSPFSENFVRYKNLDKDEMQHKIKSIKSKAKNNKQNEDDNTKVDYYLKRYTNDVEEAEKMLSERQSTFSLEKCIGKYGEIEGYKKWKARQDKWQSTINSKSSEELEQINKKKIPKINGYSRISQKLFWNIYNVIKNDFNEIYFATLDENKELDESGKNYEYIVSKSDGKSALLDFYIKDINKVIEFDGDYWHGEKRGNQKRDEIRESSIIEMNPDIKILHIKERDFNSDPENIIERCMEFIYER